FFLFFLVFSFISSQAYSADLIQPQDLIYKGAFRLPDNEGWEYSGYAMTYFPKGDPQGPDDGFPGSLFILGHDHHQKISEVSIPLPVITEEKNIERLNRAGTLQNFQDIRSGLFAYLEIPRAGIEYLPSMDGHPEKLHFCWGQHFQEFEPSHGYCDLNLSNPNTQGPWKFSAFTNYVSNDYIFKIPKDWADQNTPGQHLASGRFRDGHWSGLGPALFAYDPFNGGVNPQARESLTKITPLLLYGIQNQGAIEIYSEDNMKMRDFSPTDEWSGGAWLKAEGKSSVIFAGTKAVGKSWYGFSNGVVWPIAIDENTVYPQVPPWPHDGRGWWSEAIKAQIIFYNPEDLAKVAKGQIKSFAPQPYAKLGIDDCLFDPGFNFEREKRYLLGAVAFDQDNRLLYIIERRADQDRSIVHVWKVK
ncbi:MAG: hypothetical protein JW867_01100, partial [Candidatus Omnitrophica bacterium]|nr:hypothetical protein [Candidatus Omnitrophota bacterium]